MLSQYVLFDIKASVVTSTSQKSKFQAPLLLDFAITNIQVQCLNMCPFFWETQLQIPDVVGTGEDKNTVVDIMQNSLFQVSYFDSEGTPRFSLSIITNIVQSMSGLFSHALPH